MYEIVYTSAQNVVLDSQAKRRLEDAAALSGADMVYSDYRLVAKDGSVTEHPLCSYTRGSVRSDFDFGPVVLVRKDALPDMGGGFDPFVFYAARLRMGKIEHVREFLYSAREVDDRASGQKQFDYVDPRNSESQKRFEEIFTDYLKEIGAAVGPDFKKAPVAGDMSLTVVIPVRNRVATVGDAIESALSQKVDVPFNVIVVDNHSTDGTTGLLEEMSARDDRVIHVIPKVSDLGIGGCWNEAVNHPRCGTHCVQLDSDDIYSGPGTLQKIADKFRETGAAMVVGSYTVTDFNLKPIHPGLVDHKEWTASNGANNALRINGFGAPRAFCTEIVRRIGFPNVSYGEDYAVGLAISREWLVGRIWESIYCCRRWEGNSDASLSPVQLNRNNAYKDEIRGAELSLRISMNTPDDPSSELLKFSHDQLSRWALARDNYRALKSVRRKSMTLNGLEVAVQLNPARAISSKAKMDKASIEARPCFLCRNNRPAEQMNLEFEGKKGKKYHILANPYPIFQDHLVVASDRHVSQSIWHRYADMLMLSRRYSGYTWIYNGPQCGASAPDHMHFQAFPRHRLPLEEDVRRHDALSYVTNVQDASLYKYQRFANGIFVIEGITSKSVAKMFYRLVDCVPVVDGDQEPRFNLFTFYDDGHYVSIVVLRTTHRSSHYGTSDPSKHLSMSPGCVDMGGVFITVDEEDFEKLNPALLGDMVSEVTIDAEMEGMITERLTRRQRNVEVGIMSAPEIEFEMFSDGAGRRKAVFRDGQIEYGGILYDELFFEARTLSTMFAEPSFTLFGVTIGSGFHWERKEDQSFAGALKIMVSDGALVAVNILGVEDYLVSVISSEMSSRCDLEFLKAHAVISRSWIMRRIESRPAAVKGGCGICENADGLRWYDYGDHSEFDVCADDHCQRYQGLTRAVGRAVRQAVDSTWGQVLRYDGALCDARFSKCCGGVTEQFSSCWGGDRDFPYLRPLDDGYCSKADKGVLGRILNGYDSETTDFSKWRVIYAPDELSAIIRAKTGRDLGRIRSLEPLSRGPSGRIISLKVIGELGEMIVGKELEIRRILSESHLKSSNFTVTVDELGRFVLDGKGWGHGVGLCQIGAAVMASEGRLYREILAFYYPGTELGGIL